MWQEVYHRRRRVALSQSESEHSASGHDFVSSHKSPLDLLLERIGLLSNGSMDREKEGGGRGWIT